MRGVVIVLGLCLVTLGGCFGGGPGSPRDTVRVGIQHVMNELDSPVFVTTAGDGSGRLFVVEQEGYIRVWNTTLESRPFLDIYSIVSRGGERGFLGLAFHPNYTTNGRLFVQYTALDGDVTIAEYTNPTPGGNQVDASSGRVLLSIEHSTHSNHNGGMLAFGPDGMLYAGIGDGGGAGDSNNNAQNLGSRLGKILRLDVNGDCPTPICGAPGNLFPSAAVQDEVWHYGLRNPWRFSFDRKTGDLWIGDVGQSALEEIDFARAGVGGLNFGWSRFEGSSIYNAERDAPNAVPPVAEYANNGRHCAVTGGYVYRGNAIPGLQGAYVFGDYCSGTLWTLRPQGTGWERRQLLQRSLLIASFAEDADGELLIVDHAGDIYRMVAQ